MGIASRHSAAEYSGDAPSWKIAVAIGILSASSLGYEIILLKLLSYGIGHLFASMTISLALLGIGASGSFLTVFRKRLSKQFPLWMPIGAAAFSLSVLICPFAAFRLGFLPDSFMWDPWQMLRLAALYGLLSVPFFFSGGCVGLALAVKREFPDSIYRADLMGAGIGGITVLTSLAFLDPETSLKAVCLSGIVAAILLLRESYRQPRLLILGTFLISAVILSLLPNSALSPPLSPYKPLNKALLMPGSSITAKHNGLWGKCAAVASPELPIRHAPGMSLFSTNEPPEQIALFCDGEPVGIVTQFDENRTSLAFFEDLPTTLPYLWYDQPSVLVLGAGGGFQVLEALYHKARRVEAVEPNRDLSQIVDMLDTFSGKLYKQTGVNPSALSPRVSLEKSDKQFDIIAIPMRGQDGLVTPVTENYLMTKEGVAGMLSRLTPDGVLMATLPLEIPDRAGFRLLATTIAALEDHSGSPGSHLTAILSPTTFTLLVAKKPLSKGRIQLMRHHCEKRGFSLVVPGDSLMSTYNDDASRYAAAFNALLDSQQNRFIQDYPWDITPPTDDRPFFNVSFKMKYLDALLPLLRFGAMPLVDWGWVLLLTTLGIAICFSMAFILCPLLPIGRRALVKNGKAWTFVYFTCLGFAFMFLELVSIKKLVFCLGNPVVAAGSIISTFLIFAGLGAGASRKICPNSGKIALGIQASAAGIIISSTILLFLFPALQLWLPRFPLALQYILGSLVFGPTAFFMGMPFPLGLRLLSDRSPDLIPWAWAVNGCASVVSPLLALVLGVNFGYLATAILALGLYLLATLAASISP